MNDAVDSFKKKWEQKTHHKGNHKFVDQVTPISLPLASSTARMPTAKFYVFFVCLTLVLSVAVLDIMPRS